MRTKLFIVVLALVFLGALGGADIASAQATFRAGCDSALGYSITNGSPCNGTSTATMGPLPGCSTALGYSITSGAPCSGGSVAISYLGGCTSIYGYSTVTGRPCNGTTIATVLVPTYVPPSPGFPTTGQGGEALPNLLYLGSSLLIAALGIGFLARKRNAF